jgi:hypothetical protein
MLDLFAVSAFCMLLCILTDNLVVTSTEPLWPENGHGQGEQLASQDERTIRQPRGWCNREEPHEGRRS